MSQEVSQELSHIDPKTGAARMVDVSEKPITRRKARARARIRMRPETLTQIVDGTVEKGDVLATARLAGIMAAKRTDELIPLCHPLPIDHISVDIEAVEANILELLAESRVEGRTGVEMEAMTAVSIAALTVYDMCKAVDRTMAIENIVLLSKEGGRSGSWHNEDA